MKKMLTILSGLAIIGSASSTVVSCGIKQSQLSFNLADWKNSWAFTTQKIWQALGNRSSNVLLSESKGLFLYKDNPVNNINQLFNIFDQKKIKESDSNSIETWLQLKYFIPSIIFYNEKPYDSQLKDYHSITENFTFEYSSSKKDSIHDEDWPKEQEIKDETQRGPVAKLFWGSTQAGETLSAYFDLKISLKIDSNQEGKTKAGYFIDDGSAETENEKSITWNIGVYFSYSSF